MVTTEQGEVSTTMDLSVLIPSRNAGIRNPMFGKHHTEEAREKIRVSRTGRKMPRRSEEYRQNVSKRNKGKVLSEETKRKISEAHIGKPSPRRCTKLSEQTKQKIREANLGKTCSTETREKLSKAGKGKIAWNKGKKLDPRPQQSLLLSGERNPNWKGGISYEPYTQQWDDALKGNIRKRDNYFCAECGIREDQLFGFYKKLDVHHIDYNKNNLSDKNLVSLCRKCHAKTSFNREYWKECFNIKYE